jgi:AraC-like DNA-binding protein
MTVHLKKTLLTNNAFTKMHLIHAAFVDSFEVHVKNNRMPINRFLFVTKNDTGQHSAFRDIANDKLFPMRENNLYFIPCNHLIDLDIESDLSFISLQFNFDIFYGFDIFDSYSHCEMREMPELIAELSELLIHEKEFKTLCRVNEIIYGLCASWNIMMELDIQGKISNGKKYQKVLDFIRNSGDATTTVEQLAEISNMRRDVFSRNFTRDMEITPKGFISATLVRNASEMLICPGILVKEVAEKMNFSSEYYFSSFFKRQTGMSPKEFQCHNRVN